MKKSNHHRVIEQQRRSHMSMLFSTLKSLLPSDKQEMKLPFPDVIQEASNHIEGLKKQIAELSSKRDAIKDKPASKFSPAINLTTCGEKMMKLDSFQQEPSEILNIPRIFVNCFGSTVTVEIINYTLAEQILLSDIIFLLEGDGLEILSASTFSTNNRNFHSFHLKASNEVVMNVETLYEKLRCLIATNSWRALQNNKHDAECSSGSLDQYIQEYSQWEELFHIDNI